MMTEPAPAWCAEYMGIPFLERGRSRKGIDCWGLVWLIFKEQRGIDIPSYVEEYEQINGEEQQISQKIQTESLKWDSTDQPILFDVVLFRIAALPLHVGVVVGQHIMIHSLKGCDVAIEQYRHPLWTNRLEGFYRYAV